MARPVTTADLPPAARRGSEIASFNMNGLPASAAVLTAVAAFLKAAESLGLQTSNERYSSMQVFAVQTPEEARDALISAQDTWDSRARSYDAVLAIGTPPSDDYDRRRLAEWSAENGVPAPWTPEAAQDSDGGIAALLGDPARVS